MKVIDRIRSNQELNREIASAESEVSELLDRYGYDRNKQITLLMRDILRDLKTEKGE